MKYLFNYIIAGLMLLTFISPLLADVIGDTDKQVRAIAEPILDSILDGFATNDYQKYSQDFDDTLKESVSEDKFIETDRKIENFMGTCRLREYLGFLAKGKMTLVLWKGEFDKISDDILIKLVVSKRG